MRLLVAAAISVLVTGCYGSTTLQPMEDWRMKKYHRDTKSVMSETMFWKAKDEGTTCIYALFIDHETKVTIPTLACY